ncbi:hypothetical protein [Plebeiibacterium marinum]|uniref:Uncharacterized protein n=1 Tax=Plebeiibacterium marinum TaxID=2992111 RepID=A0AAE3MFX0_9BACT|nr:hypothetical protein [Plebeiobacterium marinum]MCW3806877.1 hypothetical protein [Plebeiobacterium marinum]
MIILLGILIKDYIETFISMIIRKPIPDNLIDEQRYNSIHRVIKWIGIMIILCGVGMALLSLSTLIMGFNMPMNNFNFKF